VDNYVGVYYIFVENQWKISDIIFEFYLYIY